MKKSELRKMIQEEYRKAVAEASIADESRAAAVALRKDLESALATIGKAFDDINSKMPSTGAPGLAHAFNTSIHEGRPHLGKSKFDLVAAKRELGRYYDKIKG